VLEAGEDGDLGALVEPRVGRVLQPPSTSTGAGCARAATLSTASTILRYPVQRQSTPPSASSTAASSGAASRASRSSAAISMPGVQIPH
jgi:hypothetical protein